MKIDHRLPSVQYPSRDGSCGCATGRVIRLSGIATTRRASWPLPIDKPSNHAEAAATTFEPVAARHEAAKHAGSANYEKVECCSQLRWTTMPPTRTRDGNLDGLQRSAKREGGSQRLLALEVAR